jgi:hypothetical protein
VESAIENLKKKKKKTHLGLLLGQQLLKGLNRRLILRKSKRENQGFRESEAE